MSAAKALPSAGRRRIETFWRNLERVRIEDLLTLAARPLDQEAHRRATEAAQQGASDAGLGETIAGLRRDVRDWVVAQFNRSTVQPGWMEANWGRPGTVEDRAGLAASLEEAVVALALWDVLDEADRDELLGAWESLVASPG